jgi:hypothetical protein
MGLRAIRATGLRVSQPLGTQARRVGVTFPGARPRAAFARFRQKLWWDELDLFDRSRCVAGGDLARAPKRTVSSHRAPRSSTSTLTRTLSLLRGAST